MWSASVEEDHTAVTSALHDRDGLPGADLAATGVSIYPMLLAAAAMLGCGLVLLAGSRRRATGADRRR